MPYRTDIPGWMTIDDLAALERITLSVPPSSTVVEIGSFCGKSSWCIAKTVDPSTKVYCIDPWVDGFWSIPEISFKTIEPPLSVPFGDPNFRVFNEFRKNTADCPNVIPMRAFNPEGVDWQHGSIDMIFIDDDHEAGSFIKTIQYWEKFFKPKTLVCGHDYNEKDHPELAHEIRAFAERRGRRLEIAYNGMVWWLGVNAKR